MPRKDRFVGHSVQHCVRLFQSRFVFRLTAAACCLLLLQAILKKFIHDRTTPEVTQVNTLPTRESKIPSMPAIRQVIPLGRGPWRTQDPFLFCAYHNDHYPVANKEMAPSKDLLRGRHIGSDFSGKDGWSMYHGSNVPGFPQHPHRGFETITFVRSGFIDHSDSLGATARFGKGDVQWMTAGKGIVHAEMFPLLDNKGPNPLELFQIWLNLPAAEKMVEPHFAMLWAEDIPSVLFGKDGSIIEGDGTGESEVKVTVVAGELHGRRAPPPPPHSWASKPEADVLLLHGYMRSDSTFILPPPRTPEAVRTLYVFDGGPLKVGKGGEELTAVSGGVLHQTDQPLVLQAGTQGASWILMQGKPIAEPVAQHGPFVMNTQNEIQQAFSDYRATQFGGWPWPSDDPNHGPSKGRFANHADGKVEER